MAQSRSSLNGALLALLGFGLYATHDAVIKHLGGIYSPFQILFFSVLFSFPLVTLYIVRNPRTGSLWPHHPWLMLGRVLAISLTGVFAFTAFTLLPLTQAYALLFLTPVLITALSIPVLGETVGWRRWAAILVGFIGVIVVLNPNATELSAGHLACLGAVAASASNALITRKIGSREKTSVMLIYPLLGNILIMGLVLPFVYVPMPLAHLGSLMLISLLGILAMFCITNALREANAGVVSPMQYSQIIWAGFFGSLFFEQNLTWSFIGGAMLIVASGLYIVRREWTRADSLQPVLSSGSFRPDSGLRPKFLFERVFRRSGWSSDKPAG